MRLLVESSLNESVMFLPFMIFLTIFWYVTVFKNLGELFNNKKIPIFLLIIRVILLVIIFFYSSYENYILIDFFGMFIFSFIFSIIETIKKGRMILNSSNQTIIANNNTSSITVKCSYCAGILSSSDKICPHCGAPNTNFQEIKNTPKIIVNKSNFDSIYSKTEDQILEELIKKELQKASVEVNNKKIPQEVLRRKKILEIIYAILLCIYISMIFIHFPLITYIIGFIIIMILFFFTGKYNLMKYLKKEIKSRPSEKISNIIMNTKVNLVDNTLPRFKFFTVLVAIVIPEIIFMNPRVIYEKVDGGYAVRYYTFGLTNFTSIDIPETYKDEKVVELRGNAFSNMPFLKEAVLPKTIKEIRGQAFLNDENLVEVVLPDNLEYLGGGAFENCTSLTSITLPDSLKELGGESFKNATSLRSIKFSKKLKRIGGSAFENCISLSEVILPQELEELGGLAFKNADALKRVILPNSLKEIRGQTFMNDYSLETVILPQNLTKIGGSAFNGCQSLKSIDLPSTLEEIEGAAFSGCSSLKEINIPNSVTILGGESFKDNTSLVSVKLSEGLTEIRGNTFENCSSLKEINIPNNVTRIGGHAFYGNISLSLVNIPLDSKLEEIGSSAFRRCNSLYSISLPKGVSINERSFKESPTSISYFEKETNYIDDLYEYDN